MRKVLLIVLFSSLVIGNEMSGWNNSESNAEVKAQEDEKVHMCALYTKKIEKYKETIRDDGLAQATLNNYVRLQTKYCAKVN